MFFLTFLSANLLFSQWNALRPKQTHYNLNALSFVSDSVGWIVGEGRSVYFTDNFGDSLQAKTIPFSNGHALDVHALSADTAYVLLSELDFAFGLNNTGFEKHLLTTFDGGSSWQQSKISSSTNKNLVSLGFYSKDTMYVGGDNGELFRTYNGGMTWDSLSFPLNTRTIRAIHPKANGELMVAGDSGFVYRSVDYGMTWNSVFQLSLGMQFGQHLHQFFAYSPDTIYVCGRGRSVARSDDGGVSWTSLNNQNNTVEFTSIHFKDTLNGLAVGGTHGSFASNGTFFRTNDGGRTWIVGPRSFLGGIDKNLTDMHVAGDRALAIGQVGQVITSSNYGISRDFPNELSTVGMTTDIEVIDDSIYVMSCRQGGNTFLRSTDYGKSWNAQKLSFTATPYFLANNDSGLLVSARGNKTFKSYDKGASWVETTNAMVNSLAEGTFLNPSTFIGYTLGGSDLLMSTDTFNTFTSLPKPGNQFISTFQAVNDSVWFTVTTSYDLYRTLDAGASWQLMKSNANSSIHFDDSLNGWGVRGRNFGFFNGVMKTNDGGVTWTQQMTNTDFDSHRFQFIKKKGNLIIASCGIFYRNGILISTDNGQTWTVEHDLLPYFTIEDIIFTSNGTIILDDDIGYLIENRALIANNLTVGLKNTTQPRNNYTFKLYPNPTKGTFTLETAFSKMDQLVEVYSITGKKLHQQLLKKQSESISLQLPPGIYLIRIGKHSQKLVIE